VTRRVLLIPFHNEARTLTAVLQGAAPFFEVILLVDDGSTDGSADLARSFLARHPGARLWRHSRNLGMAGALATGLAAVVLRLREGWLDPLDTLVTMDADSQHRVEDALALGRRLETGSCDLCLGRRDLSGYPSYKKVGNRVLSAWASVLSGCRLADSECGLRALRAASTERLLPYYTGYRYSCAIELVVLAGRLGLRIDNSLSIRVPHYRAGRANVWNGIQNALLGLVAVLRLGLGLRRDLESHLRRVKRGAEKGRDMV